MKATPQISPSETNRTVLMVDGHGRIRTIHKFHQKLGIGIALVVLALLIAAGAIWMYADGLKTQGELRRQIDALRAQVTAAEHQKDLFLARAVKAEARVANSDAPGVATTPSKGAPPVARTKRLHKAPSLDAPAAAVAPPAVEKQTASPTPAPQPEPLISVTVDTFKAAYLESEKSLTADFIIRNTGNTQAQGRSVVVLSSKENATAPRLTLPPVPLRNDRPRGNRGRRFAITRFMRVKLQRKVAEPGLAFDTADVFVFDMQGQLLQEKTFEVAVRLPVEAPPASSGAAPVEEAPPPAATVSPPGPVAPTPEQHPVPNSILAIPANSGQESERGQEE